MSDPVEAETDDKASYAAPALEKGLDILELLAEVGEPLSTRTIAEQLRRSKSEIFRMVFVLQQRGYLEREAGTDRLGLSRRLAARGFSPRRFQLTMSRTDIANYLRQAPETVSRVLRRFEHEGVLHIKQRDVEILDSARLEALALAVLRE